MAVSVARAECTASDEISMQIDSGLVCGRRAMAESNVTFAKFLNVPYAEQPIGKCRFSELRAKVPWEGYLDASTEGPICPQYDRLYGDLVYTNKSMSDGCIHANVYVPLASSTADLSSQSGLPILVFIHGGAFEAGSGDPDSFGPEYLVSKGIIVITFNYRLAIFGFLSLDTVEIPGNAGLRDAVTLLKWVQTNAAAFGGNPQSVTVMGQSSGAAIAHLLSLSNATQGLMSGVIAMSGSGDPSFFNPSDTYAKYVSNLYLTQLGINSTNTTYIHETLTEMSLDTIMEAYKQVQSVTGICYFVPKVESKFDNVTRVLDMDPVTAMLQGRGNQIPMMIGFTNKEMLAFEVLVKSSNIVESIKNDSRLCLQPRLVDISTNVSMAFGAEAMSRYFKAEPTWEEYCALGTDSNFIASQFYTAKLRAQTGGANVFLYMYSYTSENQTVKAPLGMSNYTGAVHIEDLTYIMRFNKVAGNYVSFPPTNDDDRMKDWMTDFVVNFTRCGDPTCSGGTLWQPVTTSLNYQLIAKPYEYNNTLPTSTQLDMMGFFERIEAERIEDLSASSG